ncbi:carcinoembryonic antigen-related cell adhesion molecule 5-like [Channa argus]|uniref:carcinoembryonic antigen-related cell adhesion molecule 5-like n=1 Tax=Channa argus TaxID=215402 RepID=UPI00352207A8
MMSLSDVSGYSPQRNTLTEVIVIVVSAVLCVTVIQGQNDWGVTYNSTQICGIKGSTVDINCTYTYPSRINGRSTTVQTTSWFTKWKDNAPVDLRTDPDYTGRVEYYCPDKVCTLTIRDVRQRDSAVYKFRFITNQPGTYTSEPGVTLSVTDLQVLVITSRFSSWAKVTCQSSCLSDRLSYIWYKNGQKIQTQSTSSYADYFSSADSISCAVKGHEKFPSPSVYPPQLPSVSVSPSAEIVEGSSVTLTCSSDANPAANYTWYKNKGNLNVQPLNQEPQLVFVSIHSSDSGQYYCEAENKLGRNKSEDINLNVKYTPKLPSVSVSPSAEIVEGSSVTLTCSSDANPAANYTWYKNKGNLNVQPLNHEPNLVFVSIQSSDSGQYYCEAENKLGRNKSEDINLNVKYAPKLPSVSVSPSAEIAEGSSVTLTCSSDANPAANYTWYKENEDSPKASGQIFTIPDIRPEHSGNYSCEAQNTIGRQNSTLCFIALADPPQLPSVSVSPSAEIVEGSSVTLTCSSDANPAANYTWYKKNQTVVNKKNENQPLNQEPQLVFASIQSSYSGQYYCEAENKLGRSRSEDVSLNVKYPPQLPSVSVSPSAEIVEGSSVTVTCSSDANPAANYTWYKKNQTVVNKKNGILNVQPLNQEPQLVFVSIQSSDSGQYYCEAENELGRNRSGDISLNVKYPPQLPSVSVSPSAEIVEGSSVTLTCSSDANPAANYTWYKENEDSPKASGQIFTITDIKPEHSGNYSCEAQNTRGRQNATLYLIVAAGSWKSAAAGVTTAVLLLLLVLCVFLWIRNKKNTEEPSEPEDRPDNREQHLPAEGQSEEQENLLYASVHFSKKETDAVYSNIRAAQPHKEEEEVTEYSAVRFVSKSTAQR